MKLRVKVVFSVKGMFFGNKKYLSSWQSKVNKSKTQIKFNACLCRRIIYCNEFHHLA